MTELSANISLIMINYCVQGIELFQKLCIGLEWFMYGCQRILQVQSKSKSSIHYE